jgi:SRSO17 transposase
MWAPSSRAWGDELEPWLEPFLICLSREAQPRGVPVYQKGLILPGEHKRVEPMADRVAPVAAPLRPPIALGRDSARDGAGRDVRRLVGGRRRCWWSMPPSHRRTGTRQYHGCLGELANGQVLV